MCYDFLSQYTHLKTPSVMCAKESSSLLILMSSLRVSMWTSRNLRLYSWKVGCMKTHPEKPGLPDLIPSLCTQFISRFASPLHFHTVSLWPAPQLCGGWGSAPGILSGASLETALRKHQPALSTAPHYPPPSPAINTPHGV